MACYAPSLPGDDATPRAIRTRGDCPASPLWPMLGHMNARPIARTMLGPMSELGIIVMLIALAWFLISF
jgi:hypothetical protein